MEPDSNTLSFAAQNPGPCAIEIMKLLMEQGVEPEINVFCKVAENNGSQELEILKLLIERNNFQLSDLMPRAYELSADKYKTYREKAILRVSELVDEKGFEYARAVAADIAEILEKKQPTKEDIKVLQPLVKKIASRDWVSDAQVSSDDFLGCNMEI